MKDEIKEIRDYIACPQLGDDYYGEWGALRLDQRLKIKSLLDYITNLQKENEIELDENNKLSEWLVKKQKRIEKAREHIKKEIADIEWMKEEYSDYDKIGEVEVELKSIEELNDILNGGDE